MKTESQENKEDGVFRNAAKLTPRERQPQTYVKRKLFADTSLLAMFRLL